MVEVEVAVVAVEVAVAAEMEDELIELGANVDIYDPWVNKKLSIDLFLDKPKLNHYDALIIAVAHDVFKKLTLKEIKAFGKNKHVLYDIKYLFNKDEVDGRL